MADEMPDDRALTVPPIADDVIQAPDDRRAGQSRPSGAHRRTYVMISRMTRGIGQRADRQPDLILENFPKKPVNLLDTIRPDDNILT